MPAPDTSSPFRWRLEHRPDVRFGHAAGGVAGLLIAAAVVAFVVEVTDEDPTLPGVAFNLLLVAAALAVGFRVRGPVRSAAVAAIVVAIPQVPLFAIVDVDGPFTRGDFRVVLLVSVAAYLVGYLLTWTRGRAVLLGLALLFAAGWLVFEVADQDTPFGVDAVQQGAEGLRDPSAVLGGEDRTTETAVTEILIAVASLGIGTVLDRRGRVGAATPFLLVGALYATAGAITLGVDVDDAYATGIFLMIAGLAIGLAGSLGRRRGTSWIGAVVLLAGAVTVVVQGTKDAAGDGDDGTAAIFGAFALIAAAALLVVGLLVARRLAEPVDGGEPVLVGAGPPEAADAAPATAGPPISYTAPPAAGTPESGETPPESTEAPPEHEAPPAEPEG